MGESDTLDTSDEAEVRFRDAILEGVHAAINREENCDLQVSCSDGIVMLPSLLLASTCPLVRRIEIAACDAVLVLPDINSQDLLIFVESLLSPMKSASQSQRKALKRVTQILGTGLEENMEEYFVTNDDNALEDVRGVMREMKVEREPPKNVGEEKKTMSNLAMANLDHLTDTVLRENFSDQEGRLVCLVCYQIITAGDFAGFREHVAKHERRQLERVTLVLPDIGRGGPGLKKNLTSEAELDECRSQDGRFRCPKCDKYLQDKNTLRKHLAYHTHKDKKYMYKCPKCPALSADPSNLKRHVASVHERQVFSCTQCDFKDHKKKHLDDHMGLVHPELADDDGVQSKEVQNQIDNSEDLQFTFQCSRCKCERKTLEDLEKHQNDKHCKKLVEDLAIKRLPSIKQNFSCHLCDATFKKGTLLNQHKLKVHQVGMETDFGCDQCGIKCANLPGLKAHQRGHIEKRFLCGSCNKSFLVLAHLKDHVERGSCLLENRKCKLCHKVYSDRIRLELHMRVHNNLKPFPCTVCEKAFTQKRSLKEHLLTHDSVRHYECHHCEKKFVQKNHLKYHLASQHAETTASEVSIIRIKNF